MIPVIPPPTLHETVELLKKCNSIPPEKLDIITRIHCEQVRMLNDVFKTLWDKTGENA